MKRLAILFKNRLPLLDILVGEETGDLVPVSDADDRAQGEDDRKDDGPAHPQQGVVQRSVGAGHVLHIICKKDDPRISDRPGFSPIDLCVINIITVAATKLGHFIY